MQRFLARAPWVGIPIIVALIITIQYAKHRVPTAKRMLMEQFAREPRLTVIDVYGFEKGLGWPLDDEFDVLGAFVRIRGRSDEALISFDHPSVELFKPGSDVWIGRIGNYSFRESRDSGEGSSYSRTLDFGPGGDVADQLPFKVRCVADVIDHYDELVALVAKLPAHEKVLSKSDGKEWKREVLHVKN